MSLAPTSKFIYAQLGTPGTAITSAANLFVRSVETLTLGTGTLTHTFGSVGTQEYRPFTDVTINITAGQFLSDANLTLSSLNHQVADLVTIDYLPSDIPAGRTINIKDDRTGSVIVAITNASSGLTRIGMNASNAWVVTDSQEQFNTNPTFLSVTITGTTASTSATTGALVVAGGVGISGNTETAGYISIRNDTGLLVRETGGSGSYGQLTKTAAGAFTLTNSLAAGNIALVAGSTGSVTIANAVASTSTTTGSLINAGGFGNAGAAYIGGGMDVAGNFVGHGNLTLSTTSSTATLGSNVMLARTAALDTNLIIDAPSTSYGAQIAFRSSGTTKWTVGRGTGDGSDDFVVYNNALSGPGFRVSSSTSNGTLAGNLTVNGTVQSAGQIKAVAIKTTTYTVTTSDHVIVGNHATTAFTITLIAASSNTGQEFVIKNKGAAVVTVSATGLGQIDGSNTVTLNQYQSVTVVSDGATWNVV